jgi:hypothetical protein
MANLQAATSEFLRQFWSAIYENKDLGQERAAKMISYLSSTHSKIAPMMTAARNQGCDPQLVRDVSRVLYFFRSWMLGAHRVWAGFHAHARRCKQGTHHIQVARYISLIHLPLSSLPIAGVLWTFSYVYPYYTIIHVSCYRRDPQRNCIN